MVEIGMMDTTTFPHYVVRAVRKCMQLTDLMYVVDVGMQESRRVEAWQADRREGLRLAEGAVGSHKICEQKQVQGVERVCP